MYFLFFLISFGSSIIGSICGIGGGVIIKPVLDAYGVLDVSVISFLSGCTVLSMTSYSVGKTMIDKESVIDMKISTPLAIGGAIGGIAGKNIFQNIYVIFEVNKVGAVQSIALFLLTFATLIYTVNKRKIPTYKMENIIVCLLIGGFLGFLSSFLGIGGGPINLVVLFFFFSMSAKVAAQNSLYIILFSQITSLINTLVTHTVPDFQIMLLAGMVLCGIAGGIAGTVINKKINDEVVNKLFIELMTIIMLVNVYNTYNFLA